MSHQVVVQELQNEANATNLSSVQAVLSRLSFLSQKEMIEAARVLSPGDVFTPLITQHATVAANALTRHISHIR